LGIFQSFNRKIVLRQEYGESREKGGFRTMPPHPSPKEKCLSFSPVLSAQQQTYSNADKTESEAFMMKKLAP
jgi:hypothetical protein